MSRPSWGWASYDVDSDDADDYVCQTDVHDNGSVHRYEATGGSWSAGHGHRVSGSMSGYLNGDCDYSRSSSDASSYGRSWSDRH